LLGLLREFLNDTGASFSCKEQELLVKGILLKVPYILGVLATSKGKTLGYLLTTLLITSKTTIVIVPLVGLKQNILKRAKDFNIPACVYKQSYTFKPLTLVSIKTVILNDAFIRSLTKLIREGRLDRIIVDECYLLITLRSY
jgi:superfamily II DNA helicase RecQ